MARLWDRHVRLHMLLEVRTGTDSVIRANGDYRVVDMMFVSVVLLDAERSLRSERRKAHGLVSTDKKLNEHGREHILIHSDNLGIFVFTAFSTSRQYPCE